MEEEAVGCFGDFAIPADLTLRILVAVPLGRQLFRLRCVCRGWNNVLHSRSFLRAWSRRYHNSCFFVMLPPFPAYPPADVDCHWRLASQWFNRGQSHNNELVEGDYYRRALGGGSRAGLVVDIIHPSCMYYNPQPPVVRVLDVLAGTYRYLPSPSCSNLVPSSFCLEHPFFKASRDCWLTPDIFERAALLLLSSEDGHNYHVVIHSGQDGGPLLIYDSRWPHTWRAAGYIPKPIPNELRHGLFENKDIYMGDLFFPLHEANTLFAYCIESDVWINIEVQFPTPSRYDSPTIMKFEGTRILMAMALFTEEDLIGPFVTRRTLHGFGVWELEQDERRSGGYKWVEVARAPQRFTEVHNDMLWIGFRPRITYSSTLICMTSIVQSKQVPTLGIRGRCMPPLVYNVVKDSWFYMPPYNEALDFVSLFSFQPTSTGLLL